MENFRELCRLANAVFALLESFFNSVTACVCSLFQIPHIPHIPASCGRKTGVLVPTGDLAWLAAHLRSPEG